MSELAFLSGFNPWGVGDSVSFSRAIPCAAEIRNDYTPRLLDYSI